MALASNSSATLPNGDGKLPQANSDNDNDNNKTSSGLKTSTRLNAPATATSSKMRPSSSLARNNSSSSLLSNNSTALSVCSLASSANQQRSVVKPMAKKSSSSLSATSSTSTTTATATKTNLSFSGIRRPVNSAVKKPPAAQVNTTTSTTNRLGPTTLAAVLRDKEAQIKLLIKERDERKYQAERMAREALEWREKFEASELERGHMTSEADDEVVELRRLAQEFEDENKALGARLQLGEQALSDLQFKLHECDCERQQVARELEFKERELQELLELQSNQIGANSNTERAISRAKYEREIEELREQLRGRDEQSMQLRSSLEMKKNELLNLQAHVADLERKLKIESERSERHLKRIDEINLELKASEAKLEVKQEENEMQEKQLKQLRQELRQADEKVESISLARKRDVELLHNKLAASRRGAGAGAGSTTPTGGAAKATPTPQDEIVRLQMEIRDLKDQLIDREAELDCNKRDLELIKRKMETRTLEVDCNNQELARRCQDLLEQNRQSEDTIKQLLKSTTEHSASLMRAHEELRESNSKCAKLREEIKELERRLDQELARSGELARENARLREEQQQEHSAQVQALRSQVDSLNDQIGELCGQLDSQTASLHKDREQLANELNEAELLTDQLRQELATARQDLRSQRLREQELSSGSERLRQELELKEKYIKTRQELIESLRCELDDCRESLLEYKLKLEQLRESSSHELDETKAELRAQLEQLRAELKADEQKRDNSSDSFDELRQKHSEQVDELRARLRELETELEAAARSKESPLSERQDYESQIEFLNSLVVDMQRKCDDYKARLAQLETSDLLDQLLAVGAAANQHQQASNGQQKARASTLKRNSTVNLNSGNSGNSNNSEQTATLMRRERVVRIQDPLDELLQLHEREQQHNKPTRHISGRPYCDICRIYDTHHTIYCPRVGEKLRSRDQQANSNHNNNNDSNFILNNNNNNNNNNNDNNEALDQLALQATLNQRDPRAFASLRRPAANQRPYCHHCQLHGHSLQSCQQANSSIRAL